MLLFPNDKKLRFFDVVYSLLAGKRLCQYCWSMTFHAVVWLNTWTNGLMEFAGVDKSTCSKSGIEMLKWTDLNYVTKADN